VVIIEDQQRLIRLRLGSQLVDQRQHHALERRRRGRPAGQQSQPTLPRYCALVGTASICRYCSRISGPEH